MKALFKFLGGTLFFCAAVKLAVSQQPQVSAVNLRDVNYLVAELHRCPAWIKARGDEHELRAAITRIYRQFEDWDTKSIREGVFRYLNDSRGSDIHADAKVFAFMRIVFAVPSGFVDDAKYFGGWGNSVQDGKVNLLWPYSKTEAGELVLSGEANKYFGAPYDPLAEFDELAARYPRRGSQKAK